MQSETGRDGLMREICERLKTLGIWFDRRNSGGRHGRARLCEPGTPDLWTPWGCLEIKLPGRPLSDAQLKWHARAVKHGLRVATAHSAEEAVEIVRAWQADVCAACRR